ncbi:MAG TPA: hypothetical protein VGN42_09820 [Pirellulales bacterium]|jgi:hypothetical protein|nr:hypothetical protein [Pirellulales bacterium]
MTIAQTSLSAALLMLAAAPPAEPKDGEGAKSQAAWSALFDRTAKTYEIYLDAEHTRPLLLRAEPVYKWTAASAGSDTHGAVYVWTYRGCPETVACFWRLGHSLAQEAHVLSPTVLDPVRAGHRPWTPAAGLTRRVLAAAPAPAEKPAARLAQMRRLGSAFSGHAAGDDGQRRELRLLNTPLFRYESSDPEIIDGALFGFVCTVGTDPEAFLLLEARRTGENVQWQYALARFSHLNLSIDYDGKQVWESLRGAGDNADQTYYLVFKEPLETPKLGDVEDGAEKAGD